MTKVGANMHGITEYERSGIHVLRIHSELQSSGSGVTARSGRVVR